MNRIALVLLLALTACPRGKDKTIEPQGSGSGSGSGSSAQVVPPLPELPKGLPALTPTVTPEAVAQGAALFSDPQLSKSGKTSCATCHDPSHGFSGARSPTDAGQQNLRRTAALANLAYRKDFGWDARYTSLDAQLAAHIPGQLGAAIPEASAAALAAYVLTRYEGDSSWDREEGGPKGEHAAGYALFMGKAQCGVCHPPPLYTDLATHRLGLIASHDEGRGRVDPKHQGEFATPTLRGAARRPAFFHDGSAPTLDAAIDWHLAGGTGQGADASIVDPALKKVSLTPVEREQLGAFVRALTKDAP